MSPMCSPSDAPDASILSANHSPATAAIFALGARATHPVTPEQTMTVSNNGQTDSGQIRYCHLWSWTRASGMLPLLSHGRLHARQQVIITDGRPK